ncbi:hypothetical protein FRC12_006949 [Ceratobasidium sp. 428]|nr:hypothetical protein FRC09_009165 [Ceratobasidium sp. 395]KAG8766329.1 hypothetical protein FRC12_006949 [Ceratobasidium sp. 428]
MEVYRPYLSYRQPEPGICYSSDSDLEPPQLSETPNETENDTPPETPLRSSILDDFSFTKYYGIKDTSTRNGTSGNKALIPPVHIAEPLVVATPHPIRPSFQSFRSFPAVERHRSQERDVGYDSEREGPIRPSLPRFRSWRRSPEVMKSSPLTTPKLGTSSGAGIFWNNDGSSPVAKRPRHPPPMDVPQSERRDIGIQTDRTILSSLEDLLADPDIDHAALWRGIVSTGVPFRVRKDRRNAMTGLGRGWPSDLAQDTSRIPTVVPRPENELFPAWLGSWRSDELGGIRAVDPILAPSRPLSMNAPVIGPVEFSDEDDMSPIALPESVLSPEDRLFLAYTQAGDYVEDLPTESGSE